MKKVIALALPILLAGCATTGTTTPAAIITQIQSAAVSFCGILPLAQDLNPLVATLVGGGTLALAGQIEQIAHDLCAASAAVPVVPVAKAGRYGGARYQTVLVHDVRIRVKRVR